ncbi:MAG TPA: hypothetical protein VFN18_06785 [Solirubrobacterales bacterium]|nr:hypothetical protein [Solirubrobacterales bacterium]
MRHFKISGALAVLTVLMMAGASSASATTLTVGGVKQNGSVAITATLTKGTSLDLGDSLGQKITCTGSEIKAKTEGTFTGTSVGGNVSALDFTGCTDSVFVLSRGSLSVTWTKGSNGTVSLAGTEITIFSTAIGVSAICKTGIGTAIGTLTGSSGASTIDVNAGLSCGILGNVSWTASYTVTTPNALGVGE